MTRPVPRPWLTYGLIAANLAAFAWSVAMGVSLTGSGQGRLLVDLGANFGTLTLRGEPWRLVTATFLHAGLLHLTMNMFGLHDGGRQIEAIYGRSGMGAIYTVAALLGALASAMRNVGPSVGASGAVFGLYGAFTGFLLRHRKQLEPGAAQAALRGMIFFFGANVMIGLSIPNVDMSAHIGGAFGGFATGWALEALPRAWSMARRALVIGTLGVVTLVGATFVVPPNESHVPVVVREFSTTEEQVIERFNAYLGEARQDRLTTLALADALERDLLPAWRAARKGLDDGGLDDHYLPLRRYAREREDAMVAMIAALRADDGEAYKAAFARFIAAGK